MPLSIKDSHAELHSLLSALPEVRLRMKNSTSSGSTTSQTTSSISKKAALLPQHSSDRFAVATKA